MLASKVKVQPQKAVSYRGRNLMLAGAGPTKGSFAYINPLDGQTLLLHAVQVKSVGTIYAQGVVADNASIPSVRIDHRAFNGSGPARPGQFYLAGPLTYLGNMPSAECAWPLSVQRLHPPRPVHSPRPVSQRKTGVIVHTKETFGRIVDSTGISYFVHASQLRPGASLMVGLRVTFVPVNEARGMAAYDVAFVS